MKSRNSTLKTAIACAAMGWMCWSAGNVCYAQNPPGLSPDLQEVVKLSQARMPDDVIKNYISSSGKSYQLSADDIIYLNSQGVSAGVISTLQTSSSAYPGPAPVSPVPTIPPQQPQPTPAPQAYNNYPQPPPDAGQASAVMEQTPPPEVNSQYFHDQLTPFGTWVDINGVTYWRPDEAVAVNPDWRPYYDMGQWVQTDNGLYWQSDYTWGDIPFHYGRWVLQPGMGWLWAPDYTWGPAWVFWRQDEGDACIGWAPLPVGAVFLNGGFWFRGVSVGLDFDFGLGESCFTFVGYDHFHEGFFRMRDHEWAHHIDREQIHGFYGHTVIRNDFRKDEHGRFVNDGIGHDRITRLTHVEHASFEERNPVGDRNRLATTHAEELHKGVGGPGTPGRGQPNNFATDHSVKPAGGNNAVHDNNLHGQNFGADRSLKTAGENNAIHDSNLHGQNFANERATSAGSVSKVYRPPVGGGGQSRPPSGGGGQTQPRDKH